MPTQQPQMPTIEGLAQYGFRWTQLFPWVWYALGIIVALFVIKKLIDRYNKNRDAVSPVEETRKIDPVVQTMQLIAALEPQEPFEEEHREDFYFQLSLLLRQMLEYRTKLPATDLTVKELKERIDQVSVPIQANEMSAFFSFLEKSDLVKFAGQTISADDAKVDKAKVVSWMKLLKPQPVVNQEVWSG